MQFECYLIFENLPGSYFKDINTQYCMSGTAPSILQVPPYSHIILKINTKKKKFWYYPDIPHITLKKNSDAVIILILQIRILKLAQGQWQNWGWTHTHFKYRKKSSKFMFWSSMNIWHVMCQEKNVKFHNMTHKTIYHMALFFHFFIISPVIP